MTLGAFSISLSVKDLAASRAFYESLGFTGFGGDGTHYLMMRSGEAVIGLFQGMFEGNLLTFNPGWDQHCEVLEAYEDVAAISTRLRDAGLDVADGPGASLTVRDPDGNVVLIDQHAPRRG